MGYEVHLEGTEGGCGTRAVSASDQSESCVRIHKYVLRGCWTLPVKLMDGISRCSLDEGTSGLHPCLWLASSDRLLTRRMRSWTQATEMSFLTRRVAGLSLSDRARNSDIRWELGVELLLLWRMPPGRLSLKVFQEEILEQTQNFRGTMESI